MAVKKKIKPWRLLPQGFPYDLIKFWGQDDYESALPFSEPTAIVPQGFPTDYSATWRTDSRR